jgi:hypothetical protein
MMLVVPAQGRALLSGWQSGLMTTGGRQKPAFNTFMKLPR